MGLVVVNGLLFGTELFVRVFAGGWLLEGALRSVFARRWRMYCMMLVDGLRLLVGVGGRGVGLVVEWQRVGACLVVVFWGCAWCCRGAVVGWLGVVFCDGRCGWSVLMLAVE